MSGISSDKHSNLVVRASRQSINNAYDEGNIPAIGKGFVDGAAKREGKSPISRLVHKRAAKKAGLAPELYMEAKVALDRSYKAGGTEAASAAAHQIADTLSPSLSHNDQTTKALGIIKALPKSERKKVRAQIIGDKLHTDHSSNGIGASNTAFILQQAKAKTLKHDSRTLTSFKDIWYRARIGNRPDFTHGSHEGEKVTKATFATAVEMMHSPEAKDPAVKQMYAREIEKGGINPDRVVRTNQKKNKPAIIGEAHSKIEDHIEATKNEIRNTTDLKNKTKLQIHDLEDEKDNLSADKKNANVFRKINIAKKSFFVGVNLSSAKSDLKRAENHLDKLGKEKFAYEITSNSIENTQINNANNLEKGVAFDATKHGFTSAVRSDVNRAAVGTDKVSQKYIKASRKIFEKTVKSAETFRTSGAGASDAAIRPQRVEKQDEHFETGSFLDHSSAARFSGSHRPTSNINSQDRNNHNFISNASLLGDPEKKGSAPPIQNHPAFAKTHKLNIQTEIDPELDTHLLPRGRVVSQEQFERNGRLPLLGSGSRSPQAFHEDDLESESHSIRSGRPSSEILPPIQFTQHPNQSFRDLPGLRSHDEASNGSRVGSDQYEPSAEGDPAIIVNYAPSSDSSSAVSQGSSINSEQNAQRQSVTTATSEESIGIPPVPPVPSQYRTEFLASKQADLHNKNTKNELPYPELGNTHSDFNSKHLAGTHEYEIAHAEHQLKNEINPSNQAGLKKIIKTRKEMLNAEQIQKNNIPIYDAGDF